MADKRRKPWISGLDDFGLTQTGLRKLASRPVTVEVTTHIPPYVYPSSVQFRRLVRMTPKERGALVRQWRRKEHARLCREIPFEDYTVRRFNGAPIGVSLTVPASSVHMLFRLRHAESVRIIGITGLERRQPKEKISRLYAVKARFAFQAEGRRNGMQLYEDRIVVISATSEKEAEKRATRQFTSEGSPCLPTSGHFFRWAFEGVLDVCEAPDSEWNPQGTAVHYEYRRRRMRLESEWHPSARRMQRGDARHGRESSARGGRRGSSTRRPSMN
jgi:hypothetical protein